ncbi:Unknown protein [Striga hermonthica]|uniref:Uncharacterized protein n=1 Tax=Striga hermonthica TaxID=68872 RepID=A0A9N7RPJ1_STRHE|nr:Unknown protein [Striga hermonthica]
MGKGLKSLSFVAFVLLLLLLFSSVLFVTIDARPIKTLVDQENTINNNEITKVLDMLHLEAVKNGGPSRGGDGHASTSVVTLEGMIKQSGPSPGDGH